ncbi:hypothetical protein OK351_09660 [Glutamicibacter sp. MNS18]|uniref:hypothetical protein n=1 Tax=Glutamicibacter sp. MNS18 TaxID=2989817 RepID=UPI0022365A08|nr:hypothetical protein [Glutamicibacter sp. MNS18]MCW4465773.1 hypothetical protein [Glutamicibacter sp. MNS18]
MTLDNSEFDEIRQDEDTDEPMDGRDSQPVTEGSSDAPQTLDSGDPLRGAESILEHHDELSPVTGAYEADDPQRPVDPPPLDEEEDPGLDALRPAAQADQRQDPDTF